MRRNARWPGLALALGVSVGGTGTASAQALQGPPIRSEVLQLGQPKRFDWDDARRADERLRALGTLDESGQAPTALHPPMPIPRMPLPPGFAPPELAAVPDLAPEAPLAFDTPPVDPLHSFQALGDNDLAIPPDTHGAVGPTELMTALNTQVRRQDRDGNNLDTLTLYGFWLAAGVGPTAPPTAGPFDPRVHYDPGGGRWITVACDAAKQQQSALLIAVSQTNTPSSWYAWKIPADVANTPGNGKWFDYPNVGFNGKWIVVQVNVFSYPGNTFLESRIYVFSKASLYAGSQGPIKVFKPDPLTYGATQVPAATYDVGAPNLYFMQLWNENSSGNGYLAVWELSGSVGSESLPPPVGLVSAPAWSNSAFNRVDFAPQGTGCGTDKIQTNDSRIQNVVQRNGKLWATHTVFYPAGGTPTRASVQWWQVQTNATLVQSGLVDDSGNTRFYAFPSIAVNKNEDVMLGFSSFTGSEFASARYAFRLKTDPLGTMQVPAVLKPGEACYFKDYGSGKNRWGDYSATVVDPTDDTKMWTIQEYAESSDVDGIPALNVWGTWWGMLDPTPKISITDPASVTEGNSGTTLVTFDVSLSMATSQTVSVNWTTSDGTATVADSDFVAASGTLTFAPGETTKPIQVAVKGDLKKEPFAETFFVDLSTPVNATLPDPRGVGTIDDDDYDPQISISDVQKLEGTPDPGTTPFVFRVTLSNPSASTITVSYASGVDAAPDAATPAVDFVSISSPPLLTFAPGEVEKTLTVDVEWDIIPEVTEKFHVTLSSPLPVGTTLLKARGEGFILDDDVVKPPVTGLAVIADNQRNRLQWLNPVWSTVPVAILVRFNKGAGGCTPPASATGGTGGFSFSPGIAGTAQLHDDPNAPLTNDSEYCYTVFVDYGGGPTGFSSGVSVQATPFLPGKVKWKYFPAVSATAVQPPTVGTDAVLAPSNDNFVYAMSRGATGGVWPSSWKPANLGSPAQARSPIVTLAGVSRMFLTTQDGWVHAIDAKTGATLWETKIGSQAQAAPAGIFTAFGGAYDYILVGTGEASNNRFYALDPFTGAVLDSYPKGGDPGGPLGAVTGMATVDYARGQVYFATFQGTNTLYCLKLGPSSDALQFVWAHQRVDNTPLPATNGLGSIDGSPVLRANKLYVGNVDGRLWAVNPVNGADLFWTDTSLGNIKGFPFPDRRNGDVYLVTTSTIPENVWALTDTGTAFSLKWKRLALKPSTPLLSTATNYLYVGVELAMFHGGVAQYQLSGVNGGDSINPVDLEPYSVVIGAPSLDLGNNMLHVGSVNGVFYGVAVPF